MIIFTKYVYTVQVFPKLYMWAWISEGNEPGGALIVDLTGHR